MDRVSFIFGNTKRVFALIELAAFLTVSLLPSWCVLAATARASLRALVLLVDHLAQVVVEGGESLHLVAPACHRNEGAAALEGQPSRGFATHADLAALLSQGDRHGFEVHR